MRLEREGWPLALPPAGRTVLLLAELFIVDGAVSINDTFNLKVDGWNICIVTKNSP